MKNTILLIVLLLSASIMTAQVKSTRFRGKDAFKSFPEMRHFKSNHVSTKKMPKVDTESLLKEDQANEGLDIPFRFGNGFDVNYTLNDGTWEEQDSVRIWSLKITSPGAYSLNFVFDKLHLSTGAELYIFNSDSSMIYGPVTEEENIEKGTFLTDLISGDEVIIQLSEPANSKENSDLRISRVVHAYKNLFISDAGIATTSAVYNCYNPIMLYPEWADESDAVAVVIINNGTALCTGSLLNNTAQDYKPYFLTAFHCIDTSPFDGFISAAEQSVAENWAFRFQYKTADASTYITYNQAYFRAAWQNSDFALMELKQSVTNNRITFLGWNKAEAVNGQATCIHHPGGDFMKISFANNSPTSNTATIPWVADTNGQQILQANTHWIVKFDNGGIEPGSSGSPLFDSNKYVIGQLHGGNIGCPPNLIDYFGRFYNSWSGGDTQATQLSHWLDPLKTGAITTNTIRYPSISGPTILCPMTNVTYTVAGKMDNNPVTWTYGSNFTFLSASGNSITLRNTGTTFQSTTIGASYSGIKLGKTASCFPHWDTQKSFFCRNNGTGSIGDFFRPS